MEVHHHPNVEKKSFKEYILEGVMIFLAVSLGFIAENIREYKVNSHKEKELIISEISDIQSDTAYLRLAINSCSKLSLYYDSVLLCFPLSEKGHTELFYRYIDVMSHGVSFPYRDNTMQQLKSAEGMTLVKSLKARNAILTYDASVRTYLMNEQIITNSLIHLSDLLNNFVNNQKLDAGSRKDSTLKNFTYDFDQMILIHDDKQLLRLYNAIDTHAGNVGGQKDKLEEVREAAINTLATLQSEYHLEDK